MNTLTIYPYFLNGLWVFDDEHTGLTQEPFVSSMSEMISRLVEHKGIRDAAGGFKLHFCDEPLEQFDAELTWLRSENRQVVPGQPGGASQADGNWYRGMVAGQQMEGWLCPALGLYFNAAPRRIFVKAEPLPAGVDPVWHVAPGDERARRFVSAPTSNDNR